MFKIFFLSVYFFTATQSNILIVQSPYVSFALVVVVKLQ